MRYAHALIAVSIIGTLAAAQEPPAGAAEALSKVFAADDGVAPNRAEIGRRFIRFFFRYPAAKLGRLEYATGLRDYYAGDVEAAVARLDDHFAKWKSIADAGHRARAGRAYLDGLQQALAVKKPAAKRAASLARMATRLYRPSETVAQVVRTRTVRNPFPGRDLVVAAVREAVASSDEPESAREKTLAALSAAVAKKQGIVHFKNLVHFKARDMDGNAIDTTKYKGKILVVDFWATWCGPCIREMPNVVAAYEKFHGEGVEFIGVSLDRVDKADAIRAIETRFGMKWPQVYSGLYWDQPEARSNAVSAVPCTYVLDRTGKTRFYRVNGKDLHEAIAQLLKD